MRDPEKLSQFCRQSLGRDWVQGSNESFVATATFSKYSKRRSLFQVTNVKKLSHVQNCVIIFTIKDEFQQKTCYYITFYVLHLLVYHYIKISFFRGDLI